MARMELKPSGSMETPWVSWKTLSKLEKAKLDVDFLKRCKTFGATPNFLRFSLFLFRQNRHRGIIHKFIK